MDPTYHTILHGCSLSAIHQCSFRINDQSNKNIIPIKLYKYERILKLSNIPI